MQNKKSGTAVWVLGAAVLTLAMLPIPARAQTYPPLIQSDFKTLVGPGGSIGQGFNDRQNSWSWSFEWFKGKLVIGTARSYDCMVQASLNRGLFGLIPYPPLDKDEQCTPDYRDLPLRAEIWTWTPGGGAPVRVYQSPQTAPIPDAPGKFVADDVGYRYMHVFREPDGTEALYISGLSPKFIYGPPISGRLLRTTDLVNFEAVPAAPGTTLGNIGNAGYRGLTTYKGRLFVIAGTIEGNGVVVESATPKLGNNTFKVISPPGTLVSELATFNGFLYLSLSNDRGFRVVKTDAVEPSPGAGYTYKEIIPHGGGRTMFPNRDVWSMKEFKNRLYIGGNGVASFFGAELFRINPDDTWEVVSGQPRTVNGVQMNPISGLGPGFGWDLTAHMWRQEVFDGRLYIGTFDMSTIFKDVFPLNFILMREMGGDLWVTTDGITFTPVMEQGFYDRFNFGIRTLQTTPYGLFAGTANYWYGLKILLGQPFGLVTGSSTTSRLAAPTLLDVERTSNKTLLSWEPSTGARRYQIFRAGASLVNGFQSKGAPGPIMLTDPWIPIGTSTSNFFQDATANPSGTSTYYVKADDGGIRVSELSNRVTFPLSPKPVTTKTILAFIDNCGKAGCFANTSVFSNMTLTYARAVQAAMNNRDLTQLSALAATVRSYWMTNNPTMKAIPAQDLELQLRRLIKRFQMWQGGALLLSDVLG